MEFFRLRIPFETERIGANSLIRVKVRRSGKVNLFNVQVSRWRRWDTRIRAFARVRTATFSLFGRHCPIRRRIRSVAESFVAVRIAARICWIILDAFELFTELGKVEFRQIGFLAQPPLFACFFGVQELKILAKNTCWHDSFEYE